MSTAAVMIGCCGANLASLRFAFARLGCAIDVADDPDKLRAASHVVLPGVGAAADAMTRLEERGLLEVLPTLQVPVLGICLGMQLLFRHSDEGDTPCLGIINETVRHLPEDPALPVPEMGWNQLEFDTPSSLLRGVENGAYAYFVHSYAAPPGPYTRAETEYGCRFSSVVQQGNFYGTQFHPERSSVTGSRILANFLQL